MRHFLDWRDYTRQPHIKQLIEQKGVEHVRTKYLQELKRVQYNDPIIITENSSPGISINNSTGADGASTQYITGNLAQRSTFTWASATMSPGLTGSDAATFTVTVPAIQDGTDFSRGHINVRKKVLLAFVTGSKMKDLGNLSINSEIDVVVTASCAGPIKDISGSWANIMSDAVADQAAGAIVCGFTNTIAPSTLLTVVTSSDATSFSIRNVKKGACISPHTTVASTTGSVAVSTDGLDTYEYNPGKQLFNGSVLPYINIPRRQ